MADAEHKRTEGAEPLLHPGTASLRAPSTTVRRKLSPAQAEKRGRVVSAALFLSGRVPYEEFNTRDIAKRAGVALGTVYRHFGSKDHLVAEALLEWSAEFEAELEARPIEGETTAARILDLVERMGKRSAREPLRNEALRRAILSSDPSVDEARRAHLIATRAWFAQAVGHEHGEDRERLIETIEYVYLGAFMVSFASETDSRFVDRLRRTVAFVTRDS